MQGGDTAVRLEALLDLNYEDPFICAGLNKTEKKDEK